MDARNAEEMLLRLFNALGNRGRDFLGFAVADTHHAVTVANDDKRGEAEATTTLDDLGNTIDRRQRARGDLTSPRAGPRSLRSRTLAATCGATFLTLLPLSAFESLEVQAGFACTLSEGSDATVVLVAPAVEDNRVNARLSWRAQRPIGRPCEPLQSCRHQARAVRLHGGRGGEWSPWNVVDDLAACVARIESRPAVDALRCPKPSCGHEGGDACARRQLCCQSPSFRWRRNSLLARLSGLATDDFASYRTPLPL